MGEVRDVVFAQLSVWLQQFLDWRRWRLYWRLGARNAHCRRLYHDQGADRSEQRHLQHCGRPWRPIYGAVFCVALVPGQLCFRFQMHRGGLRHLARESQTPQILLTRNHGVNAAR
ncbi:hypothetical protein N431DRAFT_191211 [Stipitochalara longipes BDJ]|nr:hypothetical protein N431DRAFT_191211 [Stipitochalara longipes BDJ]